MQTRKFLILVSLLGLSASCSVMIGNFPGNQGVQAPEPPRATPGPKVSPSPSPSPSVSPTVNSGGMAAVL